jgi:stage IV sporulation protein FB
MKSIELKIGPSFFLMAAVLGFLNTFSLMGTVIWMFVIFLSVLVHEYGHATALVMFGSRAKIQLFAFGGLTLPQGKKLTGWKEFTVIAMGPVFGFILYFLTLLVPIQELQSLGLLGVYLAYTVIVTKFINLFWTIVNLIPILPLDGGHLVRVILEGFIGYRAWRVSFILSFVLSIFFSIAFFVIGQFFIGLIFLLFTFQSLETLRQFKNFTKEDDNRKNKGQMEEANRMIGKGDIFAAKKCLETLLYSTHEGMIHTLAKENLAKIAFAEGNKEKSYEMLKSEEKNLSTDGILLFYYVCFDIKDFDRVIKLAPKAFEIEQNSNIAVIAAKANSSFKKISETICWLKAAKLFGEVDLQKIFDNEAFDGVRDSEEIKNFLTNNQ